MRIVKLAFLIPLTLLGLVLTVLSFVFAFTVFPPLVCWFAILLLGLAIAWGWYRKRSGSLVVSEGSLIGRQSSKDGLL